MSFITINTPIVAGDTVVSGTTDLADGTLIRTVAIGFHTHDATALGGIWSTTFAQPLPGGIGVWSYDGASVYSTNHVLVKHKPPVVNGPIDPSAMSVGGTLTPAGIAPVGTQIIVSKNGTPFATTTTGANGSWGVPTTGLINGDIITAKAGGNENALRQPTTWSNANGMIAPLPNGGAAILGGGVIPVAARLNSYVAFSDGGGFFAPAAPMPQPFLGGAIAALSTGDVVCFGGSIGAGFGSSRIPFLFPLTGILWQIYGTQSAAYYRNAHFAFTLPGDLVFVVGGTTYSDPAFTVEDGAGDLLGETLGGAVTGNSLASSRVLGYAVLLASGKILIGGTAATADLYDPGTNLFTPTAGAMMAGRVFPGAVRLVSNKVLIAGGVGDATAELYNPGGDSFASTTGPMAGARSNFTAILLNNNKVLCAGGDDGAGNALATAELYDPVADTFSPTGSMITAREDYVAIAFPDGKVLFAGGRDPSGPTLFDSAEIYDPAGGTFSLASGSALSSNSNAVTVAPVDPPPSPNLPFPPHENWAYGRRTS